MQTILSSLSLREGVDTPPIQARCLPSVTHEGPRRGRSRPPPERACSHFFWSGLGFHVRLRSSLLLTLRTRSSSFELRLALFKSQPATDKGLRLTTRTPLQRESSAPRRQTSMFAPSKDARAHEIAAASSCAFDSNSDRYVGSPPPKSNTRSSQRFGNRSPGKTPRLPIATIRSNSITMPLRPWSPASRFRERNWTYH
jgi:hypothetical protein